MQMELIIKENLKMIRDKVMELKLLKMVLFILGIISMERRVERDSLSLLTGLLMKEIY
jgi:hypothetical protein